MRMRDGDGIDAAETFDQRHRRVVERGDAIPQNIAVRRAQEERMLTDGECRRRADADDVLVVLAKAVAVALPQRRKRGPGLPTRRHVLPLFVTDDAMSGRAFALRILRAAGGADEARHRFDSSAGLEQAGDRALDVSFQRPDEQQRTQRVRAVMVLVRSAQHIAQRRVIDGGTEPGRRNGGAGRGERRRRKRDGELVRVQ